jgi:excisionase family DNA binding protein
VRLFLCLFFRYIFKKQFYEIKHKKPIDNASKTKYNIVNPIGSSSKGNRREVKKLEKYLTCEQVAERYGVKVMTVWAWIREKKLPAIRIGKGYRVKPEDLEAFEETRRTK